MLAVKVMVRPTERWAQQCLRLESTRHEIHNRCTSIAGTAKHLRRLTITGGTRIFFPGSAPQAVAPVSHWSNKRLPVNAPRSPAGHRHRSLQGLSKKAVRSEGFGFLEIERMRT